MAGKLGSRRRGNAAEVWVCRNGVRDAERFTSTPPLVPCTSPPAKLKAKRRFTGITILETTELTLYMHCSLQPRPTREPNAFLKSFWISPDRTPISLMHPCHHQTPVCTNAQYGIQPSELGIHSPECLCSLLARRFSAQGLGPKQEGSQPVVRRQPVLSQLLCSPAHGFRDLQWLDPPAPLPSRRALQRHPLWEPFFTNLIPLSFLAF